MFAAGVQYIFEFNYYRCRNNENMNFVFNLEV